MILQIGVRQTAAVISHPISAPQLATYVFFVEIVVFLKEFRGIGIGQQ